MNQYLSLNNLKNILTKDDILKGNFGFEKEGLRITPYGELSLTSHPEIFGNKLTNPYITTDFSESQVEIITPVFDSLSKAHKCLSFFIDIVNSKIPENEYIWNQSLPCILPDKYHIPLAEYEGKKGVASRKYREKLAERYGTKKQLISGIHYNYSLNEKTIQKLYETLETPYNYREFKDQIYLKISRNYLKYKWFLIYLTCCSTSAHETFTKECLDLMENEDNYGSKYSSESVSFRNSKIGYKNLEPLYPDYTSVETFVSDVKKFIAKGKISEAKELYTQIRLKPHDRDNYLESLEKDGILYVELRTIDINPFIRYGINKIDAELIHLLLIYMLLKDEENIDNYQEIGVYNEELVAEKGLNTSIKLKKNETETISLNKWAKEIINEIDEINNIFNLEKDDLIQIMKERVDDPTKTNAYKLTQLVKTEGFIESQAKISIKNKKLSDEKLKEIDEKCYPKLLPYYKKAIPNDKI